MASPQALAIKTLKTTAAINARLERIERALGITPDDASPAPAATATSTPTPEEVARINAALTGDPTPPVDDQAAIKSRKPR